MPVMPWLEMIVLLGVPVVFGSLLVWAAGFTFAEGEK